MTSFDGHLTEAPRTAGESLKTQYFQGVGKKRSFD